MFYHCNKLNLKGETFTLKADIPGLVCVTQVKLNPITLNVTGDCDIKKIKTLFPIRKVTLICRNYLIKFKKMKYFRLY